VQLLWIFAKLGVQIYKVFKGKISIEDVEKSVNETVEKIEEIKEEISPTDHIDG
jgi:hypothetical protein